MKIYACPDEVPFAEPDYRNYDREKEVAKEVAHRAALKAWLKGAGYTGKHTGETVRFPMADGYAEYMLGDGKKSILIHLPYGDAWDCRDAAFVPKKEILRRIESGKRIASIFAAKKY